MIYRQERTVTKTTCIVEVTKKKRRKKQEMGTMNKKSLSRGTVGKRKLH